MVDSCTAISSQCKKSNKISLFRVGMEHLPELKIAKKKFLFMVSDAQAMIA